MNLKKFGYSLKFLFNSLIINTISGYFSRNEKYPLFLSASAFFLLFFLIELRKYLSFSGSGTKMFFLSRTFVGKRKNVMLPVDTLHRFPKRRHPIVLSGGSPRLHGFRDSCPKL